MTLIRAHNLYGSGLGIAYVILAALNAYYTGAGLTFRDGVDNLSL